MICNSKTLPAGSTLSPKEERTMEIECVGQITEMGEIAVEPSLLEEIKVGAKIRLKITVPEKERTEKRGKDLSPGARQFLDMLENARPIGVPDDPEEISHSRLAEERMEEKFPWLG